MSGTDDYLERVFQAAPLYLYLNFADVFRSADCRSRKQRKVSGLVDHAVAQYICTLPASV